MNDMTEIDERDPKKQIEGKQSRRLELKKTVETGQVRQSFAHGRSKMVTVEVRKKRTFAPDPRGRPPETSRASERDGSSGGAAFSGTARPDSKSREGAAVGLTNAEKATRVRALQDAMRAEEDRHLLPASSPLEETSERDLLEATPDEADAADAD